MTILTKSDSYTSIKNIFIDTVYDTNDSEYNTRTHNYRINGKNIITLSNSYKSFDLLYMDKTLISMRYKFRALKYITVGDRLCVYNDILYLDTSPIYLRWVLRRISRQGIKTLYTYLSKEMNEYINLIQTLIDLECIVQKYTREYSLICKILSINKKFIEEIFMGIKIVHLTYINCNYRPMFMLLLDTQSTFISYIQSINNIVQ